MQKNKVLFIILFLLNLFNYIDRQVLYSVFPLLQTDLHLSDGQLGLLASVFMGVYMCYAPLMGYLADRFKRPRLIAFSALLWSGATLLCGAARNFTTLLTARGLTGVGEGGFTTIAQPFLAEKYPKEKHASLLAAFGLALPLGSALGYVLGGWLGQTWGWRLAFMVVSIPGVLVGLLAWFLPDETRVQQKVYPSLSSYGQLFKNKPFLSICLAQAMITFMMGGYASWMPTYFVRYLHIDVAHAGTWFGGLVIVCGALGTFIGGKLAQQWRTEHSNAYYRVMMFSLAATVFPAIYGLSARSLASALISFGVVIILLFLPTGAIAAALVETTAAPIRSMAFAVNIFIIHLLGDMLSPFVIGYLSNRWELRTALLASLVVVLPGVYACYAASKKPSLQ